ncbi:MAG TPA: hypothetical protein VGB70_00995 [Allosphingosinicella sp.]|jgi:hypothetical protein
MLGTGLALWARRSGRARFSPLSLFAAGEQGAWFDPSDLSSMFADTEGTVPAALGGGVARINDKSGRGNHAVQAIEASRPLLKQEAGGRFYLEFDGVNDWLVSSLFALDPPWDRVSALRQTNWVGGRRIFGNGSGRLTGLLYFNPVSPSIGMYDGAGAPNNAGMTVGTTAVVTERHHGAESQLIVDGTANAGNSGINPANGFSIGADGAGGSPAAFALFGLCLVKAVLGTEQMAALQGHFARKGGVAL